MIARFHALVEPKIEVVKEVAAGVGISQPACNSLQHAGLRGRGGRRLLVDQQFDPDEVAGLNVLDYPRKNIGQLQAVEQDPDAKCRLVSRRMAPEAAAGAARALGWSCGGVHPALS